MQNRQFVRVAVTTFALMLAGGVTARAHAQYVAEFTPFFTSYYALGKLATTGTVSERQYAAPGGGARLTVWLSPSIGIEAAGAFVASGTQFTSSDPNVNGGVSLTGTIITANGRLVFRPARTNLYLLVGGGMVKRGGDTWNFPEITKKTAIGGVVGFGARANVTPKFALNVTVESNIYKSDPDGSTGTAYDSKLQSDIYVSIGVPIGFGRR
jgi:Outer membrane protein beta-barrel domain